MQRFLLQISVAACALLPIHSNAETWEIEGLEPPAKLAKAERAFLDVRNAKRDLADIPQNASDTIGSVEDEIFQIQKRISNAIAEYNTRERGMEAEIESDNVLRERAVEEARIERERLDKEHSRLTGVYQRAHENKDNLSLEDISKLRAEIEPRLAKNEELRIKNRDERDNVLRALERRATARENELLDLAAKIPDQSDLMRPEDRLRRVKTIKFEAEQKLEKLRTDEHDTAIAFLRELYATAPEHLVVVTASQNKKLFYKAEWKPTGEASATTQAEKDAIASVIAEEEAKLRILENSTKTWRRVVREHAQSIKLESDSATEALNLIADEQYRTVWINASLEITGTIIGAAGTGGISSVIQLASQTGKAFASVKKATKLLGSVTGQTDKFIIENVSTAIGKLVNVEAVGALSAANKIYDFEFGIGGEDRKFNVSRETGFKSDAVQLVAGDMAEFVMSTTAEEISKGVARNMGILTKATKAAASVSEVTKGAGVELATTGLKAIVSARAQALNNARAKQYITSHIVAEALHVSFLNAKRVWLRLDAVTKAHREMVEALKLRLENGPRALEMEKESKLTELSEGDTFDMVFEFSNPVSTEPVISAEGLSFLTLEPVTSERRKWKAKVLVERDNLDDVQLDVGYKDSERPWQLLDSNPATPPRLASLLKDHWDGYEAGNDTNHVLRLGDKRTAFKCAAPQSTASAGSASEDTTIIAGIVETEKLDCSYWVFVPWGVLGVQVTDDRIEAEWVKTFDYERLIAEIFDEAYTDDSMKRMGFKPGKFFSATNASPQTYSDVDFDPVELWDRSAAGIYNGQISTTMTYACDIRNVKERYNEVSAAFSSPVSVLLAPTHSNEIFKGAGISIAFDASEYFKREIVQEYTDSDRLVKIYGVKECGIEGQSSSLGRTMVIKGYPVDSDQDPMSFTPKSLLDYVATKKQIELPNYAEMEPLEIFARQLEDLPQRIRFYQREHIFYNGLDLSVSPAAIEDWLSHPKGRLSAIKSLEQNLVLMQQQYDALK